MQFDPGPQIRRFALITGFLLTLAGAPPLRGGVILSTFGPGDSFQGSGYSLSGAPDGQSIATAFTPGADFELGQVDVAMGLLSGPNSVRVSIYGDQAGVPQGSLVSWLVNDQMGPFSGTIPLIELPAPPGVILLGGETYYLIAEAGTAETTANWNFTDLYGPILFRFGSDADWGDPVTTSLPAFRIFSATGDPGGPGNGGGSPEIPEPGTWALMGAGLAGLGWLRRRKSR